MDAIPEVKPDNRTKSSDSNTDSDAAAETERDRVNRKYEQFTEIRVKNFVNAVGASVIRPRTKRRASDEARKEEEKKMHDMTMASIKEFGKHRRFGDRSRFGDGDGSW